MKDIIDIPVYRCKPEVFEAEVEQERAEWLSDPGLPEESRKGLWQYYDKRHGPWKYNQIIGWLHLRFSPSQVRASIFWVVNESGERMNRIRRRICHKQFLYQDQTVIAEFSGMQLSSLEIFDLILTGLKELENEKPFKGRYIDIGCLQEIGRFVDWRSFLDL